MDERKLMLMKDMTNVFPTVIAEIICDYDDTLLLDKLVVLRKLRTLQDYGIKLSQHYNLESNLEMMQYEYDLHYELRNASLERESLKNIAQIATECIEVIGTLCMGPEFRGYRDMTNLFLDELCDLYQVISTNPRIKSNHTN